jgi:hypothetical protein
MWLLFSCQEPDKESVSNKDTVEDSAVDSTLPYQWIEGTGVWEGIAGNYYAGGICAWNEATIGCSYLVGTTWSGLNKQATVSISKACIAGYGEDGLWILSDTGEVMNVSSQLSSTMLFSDIACLDTVVGLAQDGAVRDYDGSVVLDGSWNVFNADWGIICASDEIKTNCTYIFSDVNDYNSSYDELDISVGYICGRDKSKIQCWSAGSSPEEGVTIAGNFQHIATNYYLVCALSGDGTITCYDLAGQNQLQVPIDHHFVDLQMLAERYSICGLSSEGRISCWSNDPTLVVP